jgi:hypothetical protein
LNTAKISRLSHMHHLFGEYLKIRIEIERDIRDSKGSPAWQSIDVTTYIGLKLYTLEEMFLWLKKEYIFENFSAPDTYKRLTDDYSHAPEALKSWVRTIEYHLLEHKQQTIDGLKRWGPAYTSDFSNFCYKVWENDDASKEKSSPPSIPPNFAHAPASITSNENILTLKISLQHL